MKGLLFPLGFAVLFLAIWGLLISTTHNEASLAENNYQANLLRIATYLYDPLPDAVLVGTSIGGRLLPVYFESTGVSVGNLGLDGAVPMTGLEILSRRDDVPGRVLVEGTLLDAPPRANDQELFKGMENPTFKLARFIPLLRPSYRPSSVLYTEIKMWNDNRTPGRAGQPLSQSDAVRARSAEAQLAIDAMVAKIQSLKERGTKVSIIHIPQRQPVEHSHPDPVALEIAQRAGVGLIDLAAELAAAGESVRYSDGLHLIAPSARLVAHELANEIQSEHLPDQ